MEQFSFYRSPLLNVIPEPEPMTLREVWEYIRGDRAKYWTERLRETGDESIKKNKLDFVTFGGVFDYRITDAQVERDSLLERLGRGENLSDTDRRKLKLLEGKKGLLAPSELVTIDIDHVSRIGRDIRELRDELLQDKELGLRLIFISPRGDGLKLVCKIVWNIDTPEDFKDEAFSLLGYIHETHKIPYYVGDKGKKEKILDKDCTDIPRGCLLCYDPESVLVDSPGFNSQDHYFPEQEVREDMDKEREVETQKPKRTLPQGIVSSDWTDFVERKLLPAMFERIDEIFPDMDFHYRGRIWESPRKLDGSPAKSPRREKTIAYGVGSQYFGTIYEHGGDGVGYIDLYMQKTGLSFPEARKELSRICGLEEEELELRRKTAEDLNKDRRTTNTMTNKETPTGEEKVPQKGKFDKYFDLPRKGELWEELARDPEGFKTSFYFGEGDDREELVIPREGVTYICGLSSHFKSTLLRNLALQMTEDETQGEGDVIFFSLEESTRKAKLRLLCVYTDTYFKKVRDYAKTEDEFKISLSPEYQVRFKENSDKFEELLTSGKLRIYTSPENVFDLVEFLEEYRERRPIKAVFIDFIQRLKAGKVSSRTDEMRIIAETLQNFSKREKGEEKLPGTPIPVVVAAQLNRLTPSPARMGANNIAESADLTRYAETIICLWGSKKKEDVTDLNYFGSDEDDRLQKLGFILGTPGTIYTKITKNKEGESGIDGVLSVNGGTGRISQGEGEIDKPKSIKTKKGTFNEF